MIYYIKAVWGVLGCIALDPVRNAEANMTVKAALFYDAAMDGLPNSCKAALIFLNPLYCKIGNMSNQERWTSKLLLLYK